jgi:rubrerythrin
MDRTFAELKKQFQEEHLSYPFRLCYYHQEAYQKLDELLEAYKKELLEEHRCFVCGEPVSKGCRNPECPQTYITTRVVCQYSP